MKRVLAILSLLCLHPALRGQDIKSENLPDFHRVALTGKLSVVLSPSDHNAIEIKLINSDLSKIDWSIKEEKLNIRLKPSTQKESSEEDRIYYRNLRAVEASGANVRLDSVITESLFSLSSAGGATIQGAFDTKDLTVSAEGNSALMLEGTTLYLTVRAMSKAKVDARNLEARTATVTAQMGAEAFVWGTEKLDAHAGSNGVVYYKGDPEILKVTEKMMGTVEQFSR